MVKLKIKKVDRRYILYVGKKFYQYKSYDTIYTIDSIDVRSKVVRIIWLSNFYPQLRFTVYTIESVQRLFDNHDYKDIRYAKVKN